METLKNCPICGSEKFNQFLTCTDYTVSKDDFNIVSCEDCGFKFTNPRPEEKDLGAYYKAESYISHTGTKKGLINSVYHKVRKHTIKKKEQLISSFKTDKQLLDIGCGTGDFLAFCKNKGWKTTGIEPDDDARNVAIKTNGISAFPIGHISNLENESFNIISMWHVLEHVPNLNERMKELKRLLKKDGKVIIAVPNCSSFDAKKYGKFWAAYDVPRHLYHFTPADMDLLAQKHQFKLEKILPMKFDSFYVSMLSEEYKGGSKLKGILTGLFSNQKAHGYKYSSQIYILSHRN